jgi:flagellar hook-associated protein 1 FlgK
MPNTFFGIETARRALQAHQQSLETTGHNIANANTPGYSRQQAVLSASQPYTVPTLHSNLTAGQLGTGVEVSQIRRIRNDYLDTQARDSASSYHYWQTQEDIFARIESVFAEPGSKGIADAMTRFFNTWHDLNNNPQDPGVKAAVAEVGGELANMMREAYAQLKNTGESIIRVNGEKVAGGQLQDQVDTVNDIIKQVWDLTAAIKNIYANGNQPNDLLDKRDLLLDKLAAYGPVHVTPRSDAGKPSGDIVLTFMGINIYQDTKISLNIETDSTTNEISDVKLAFSRSGATVSLTNYPAEKPLKGSLLGLEHTRLKVAGYQRDLAGLASALKNTIANFQPFNDPDNKLGSDKQFFTGSLDNDFTVNEKIMTDPDLIDGTKAVYIARLYNIGWNGYLPGGAEDWPAGLDLQYNWPDFDGANFGEYFNAILADIGACSGSAANMAENQDAVNQQIQSLRESASGVNLDEELALLIQYQHGYQASARVMTTLDELLDHLINRTA